MEFDPTEEQKSLRDTVRRYFETELPLSTAREITETDQGMQSQTWKQLAEFGFTSMLVPESLGGGSLTGTPIKDAALLAEEIGRAVVGGPFVPCNVVVSALAAAVSPERFGVVIDGILSGEQTAVWAVNEGTRWNPEEPQTTLSAVDRDGQRRLNGHKELVEGAPSADHILVVARSPEGLVQVLVDARSPGVSAGQQRSLDPTRRLGSITFHDVVVDEQNIVSGPDRAAADIERQLQIAIALHCAETTGALERAFDMTLEYLQTRVAFGRPIGSYQALKHRLADHRLWLEASFGAVSGLTAQIASAGPAASELASVAKAHVGDSSLRTLQDCIQMFGGIGLTWEHDMHLFLRRAATNFALYGTPDEHRERLCVLAGL